MCTAVYIHACIFINPRSRRIERGAEIKSSNIVVEFEFHFMRFPVHGFQICDFRFWYLWQFSFSFVLKASNEKGSIVRFIYQVSGQDGWILAKLFFCVFVDRDESKSRSINSPKSNEANIQHLDRTSLSNKGFIIRLSGKCFSRGKVGSPERAR